MNAATALEIDTGKSGRSVILGEPVAEADGNMDRSVEQMTRASPGWPSQPPTMYSRIAPQEGAEVWHLSAVRETAQRQSLVSRGGGGLTASKAAARLGVQEHEVDRLRVTGGLLAVPNPAGLGWLYPACQFDDGRIVRHLDEIIAEFAVTSVWTRLYVLLSSDPALGGQSPIEALRDGDLEAVRRLVRGYGQQGDA